MSKIDLDPITSGYNLSKINANFQKVEDELNNKVLYRNPPAGEPNSMSSNLDMNSRSILNASKISSNILELGGVQVVPTNLAIDPYNGTSEALRRSYAEAGYNLVAGSFETGGTVTTASDVLLYESVGKAYSYSGTLPHTISAGSTPSAEPGMWIDRSTAPNAFKQSGTGAVLRTAQDKMRELVSVKDFGSVGDGVADDTASIQKALDYCRDNKAKLVGEYGTYKISSTINVVCDADMGEMLILCPAATVPIAVRIGTSVGSSSSGITGLNIVAPKVNNSSKTGLGWAGFNTSVGIELANLYASEVHIPYVTNFGIGVRAGGYTQGCAYNNIFIGMLFDNKISLALQKQGASGFSNQNTYYGGQYGKSGSEGSLIPGAYGIFLDQTTNNNTFINPSIETEGDLYQVYLKGSSFNTFINHRFEVADGGRVGLDASSPSEVDSNIFINGYSFSPPNFTYIGTGTSVNNKVIGQKYGDYLSYASRGIAINNLSGDGTSSPHLTGYSATANILGKNPASATDYTYRICANNLIGKRATDAFPRMSMDWEAGRLRLGDGLSALTNRGFTANSSLNWVVLEEASALAPIPDNTTSLGTSGYRWTQVFAANGSINTSDAREKTAPQTINDAVLDAWGDVNIITFKWLEAVKHKGEDAARWHFGVIAQQVRDAFYARGLDGTSYGLLCYDEWEDVFEPVIEMRKNKETGEYEQHDTGEKRLVMSAGNRWGIRPDQCLFLEAAYQRRERQRDREAFEAFKSDITSMLAALDGKA